METAQTAHGTAQHFEGDGYCLYLDLWGSPPPNPEMKNVLFYARLVQVVDWRYKPEDTVPSEDPEPTLTMVIVRHDNIGPTYHDVVRELLGKELFDAVFLKEEDAELSAMDVESIMTKLGAGLQ